MKILQIIQRPQYRGAETFACQLSEHLIALGHQVDVLFLFGDKKIKLPYSLPFIYLQANEKRRWFDFKSFKKLNNIIRQGEYDIVQANASDTLKYSALSKKIFRWKTPLVYRNANKIGDFLTTPLKRLLNTWLMRETDYVASVSRQCLKDFVYYFPTFNNKTQWLPIGTSVETKNYYSNLGELNISGSGPFILNVAGFVPEKNHRGLLNIFSKIISDFPNAQLLLIGEGPLKDEIRKEAKELKIENAVHFLGRRNDVQKVMGCCDVFVLPSLIEGLPGVILEAFVNRLPVVSYDVGGIKEIVINKKTGWLVEKDNEDKFIESLNECLYNNNENIIEEAYALVSKEYSIKEIAKSFIAFYEDIHLNKASFSSQSQENKGLKIY